MTDQELALVQAGVFMRQRPALCSLPKTRRPQNPMFFFAQFVFASLLIATASAMVLLYLVLVAMAYFGQSGLMPWVEAGMVLYGLGFVAVIAMIGVPGIFWANHLARVVAPKWQRISKIPGWIGTGVFVLGFSAATALLVREQFRPRNPYDGCVSYRDAAASAARLAPGARPEVDCPVGK